MIKRNNKLNLMIDELIHKKGYDIQFNDLERSVKIKFAAIAINDLRFDMFEIVCERNLFLNDVIGDVADSNISEWDFGVTVIGQLISSVDDGIQEIIDDTVSELKLKRNSNDPIFAQNYLDELFDGRG